MEAADQPAEAKMKANMASPEEEPGDDFCPDLQPAKAEGQSGKFIAEAAAEEEAEEARPEPPPLLTGDWQQLEGTPRPPGAGPRLLAWNEFGHVASFPDQLRLEVQRAAEEKAQRVPDYDGLHMAALSGGACCLAAGSSSAGASRVLIRPAERWEKAVFSAPLGSPGEAPEAVACGEDFAAVLTSQRLLRLYTFSGMPIGLQSMPGQSVALAARGPLLIVVTRSPLAGLSVPAEDSDDVLDFRILDARARVERAAGRLPLSPCKRLRWLGFAEDLVPIAIDTAGVVRAMLGSGAGAWGPQGGAGAEWTPVLNLADQEAELGPLWAVHAQQAALVFAEVGLSSEEPRPRASAEDSTGPLGDAGESISGEGPDAEGSNPTLFGVGGSSQLHTISWRLPLGAFPSAGDAIESAFREQLLSRHSQDMLAMDLLDSQAAAGADALEKKSKSGALKLFAQLTTAQEVERAFHVAQFSLARGGSKILEMAQKLAEKANQYKLADAIAAMPRGGAMVKLAPEASSTVPMASRKSLPPLFQPGEFDEKDSQGSEMPTQSPREAESKREVQEPSPKAASAESAAPGGPERSAASDLSASAAAVSALPSSSPAPAANPFARKRPNAPSRGQSTPHLLRDALGGPPASKVSRLTSLVGN